VDETARDSISTMKPRQFVSIALGLSAVAWAAVAGLEQWWTADDAFISFRYARNLVDGLGLVFNAGERVEGFTNLSWTLWVAVGLKLGFAAEAWANFWGLVCYLATIVLLWIQHRSDARVWTDGRFVVPVAALGAALAVDWATWSVSGMETALFTLLLTAAFVAAGRSLSKEEGGGGWWLLAGLLSGLAALTRPDGMLPAYVIGLASLVWGRPRMRAAIGFALAFAVVWLPATSWRVAYYGDFFPNTYYAKSAWLPWYEQGWHYAALFFERYWPLLAGPILLIAAAIVGWARRSRRDPAATAGVALHGRIVVLALAIAVTYTGYVVRVGGDFMFARLLIPTLPFYLLLLGYGLMLAPFTRPRWAQVAAVGLLAGIALTSTPVGGTDWVHGIADERSYYSDKRVADLEHSAEVLGRVFEGLPVRVAFYGDEARIVYRAGFPVAIEGHAGLTDREVARQELPRRGRVGHEKHASVEYLIERRAVHFTFSRVPGEILHLNDWIPELVVPFDREVYGRVLHWDPAMMQALRERGVPVPDFLGVVDGAIAGLDALPREQVEKLYGKLRRFYFLHNPDPEREAAFRGRLERSD
jgi:arabinofuranosyltransferase